MRTKHPLRYAVGWAAVTLLPVSTVLWSEAAPAPPRAGAAGKLSYNRDIRPILAENCFACHGPDSAARKAELRLDRFADATASHGGRFAVVKGNPAASEVIRRVTAQGPVMPPAATGKHLTPHQIALLKQWIAQGAEYEPHWSYIAPKRPALPAVKNAAWCRNPIDRFILAKLEAKGLKPAPEADRRTLIRRLSLDLTGLPPEPADVERFVQDRSPDAYEKLVDRLLASPKWGEHRGRYWLDYARYGDTHGIHIDNYREIWSYRDWVIHAFNQNMPFDEFTTEQLAGDLLPHPTMDQQIASGFNRCNITTSEGGAIAEEYNVLYARDRTETTAQVWLGTTAGCGVCHDHKFDPLTQKEFYQLSAFFNNTTQQAMDGNIKDTPPVLFVPMPEDRERWNVLETEATATRKQSEERKQAARGEFDRWMTGADTSAMAKVVPGDGLAFHAPLSEGQGKELQATVGTQSLKLAVATEPGWAPGHVSERAFQRRPGSSVEVPTAGDFEKDQSFSYAAWVRLASPTGGSIMARMDDQHDYRGWDLWVENGRVGTHLINKWPEDAMKVVTRQPLKPGEWHHVCVTYRGTATPAGVTIFVDGRPQDVDVPTNALRGSIRTAVPFKIGQRHTTSAVDGTAIEDVRLYTRALSADEVNRVVAGTRASWLLSRGNARLQPAEKEELFGWWLTNQDSSYRDLAGKLAALDSEERTIRMRGTVAHVMQEKPGMPSAFVLFRGEYDKRRDPVQAATPAFLPPMPEGAPHNRLGLAQWLLRPDHPLTARVTVNRFWQEVFGTGIVRTSGDFGVAGELPTHQELLDWLACEFMSPAAVNGKSGASTHVPTDSLTSGAAGARPWDMKRLFRMIVTSATYRQSALTTPEKRRLDPQNRLLSRGPRYRMDAEMVRDYALAAGGLLSGKIGGPSVKPYQPDGVWEAVAMIGSNTRDYRRDAGESLYRRSMYTFWKRAAPTASMEIFNAPTREVCTVRRERTDTPLQALVTLNDPQFVEAARNLAQHALKEGGATNPARFDFMAKRLLARPFRPEEQAIVQQSLADLDRFYRSHATEAKQLIAVGESKADASLEPERLAAWTMLANQLMNLDEVLNK